MSYAIQINPETNRIEHATFSKHVNPSNADRYILVDTLPSGETDKENNVRNYLYVNGEYIYDPLTVPEPPAPEPTVWDELDAAYQTGYDAGYREGVDTAYDQ